jgi:hypothetical protein
MMPMIGVAAIRWSQRLLASSQLRFALLQQLVDRSRSTRLTLHSQQGTQMMITDMVHAMLCTKLRVSPRGMDWQARSTTNSKIDQCNAAHSKMAAAGCT